MERIWAPWRMDFIRGEKEEGCIFCTRIARDQDRGDLILERRKHSCTFLNKFPYTNGHLMVIPYQHTADLSALQDDEMLEIMQTLRDWARVMQDNFRTEGINIGLNLGKAAGAGIVGHVHYHLIPRWVGDTNFMPVISDTRVMPEYIEKTYDQLKKVTK
jgi:ATP adenylyltransferase